jgi:hypothetical protein
MIVVGFTLIFIKRFSSATSFTLIILCLMSWSISLCVILKNKILMNGKYIDNRLRVFI